ncbi:hypothetical protein Bca52824_085505 [Brassica carinata]|uniref:Uncharacterized protein n=1 Tax=Brassica carinata TaxID=52824 RepID=A0A8X7P8F4_BRACI|nr:hypothetical protein Bca52824_085505 [Brassica carinata]
MDETKDGSIVAAAPNGPKIDLLSGDDFETPNGENSLALVPLGPAQPSSPVATPDNSMVLIDMLSDNNCESSTPTSSPHSHNQMVQQQNYSNGFGQGPSGPVWNLQITQQPSSPAYGNQNQPFSPTFSPPVSPHYGGQNNNVLALPPPPWEAQSPSSSPHYSPTHPMQVTQVVITTTHTHQPLGYNPQGGSPYAINNNPQGGSPYAINNNNNMFGMIPSDDRRPHATLRPSESRCHVRRLRRTASATTTVSWRTTNVWGYGGQPQLSQDQLVEQQMYAMSLQDNGAGNANNPYQVSSHPSGLNYQQPMMKPVNKKPEDKLFEILLNSPSSKT